METELLFDDYMREVRQYPLLDEKEEKELAIRVKQGDKEARKRFIQANLGFVVFKAKRYFYRGDKLDIIQAGNTGLIEAVKKYDPTRGTRFSTCAGWWVSLEIRKYLNEDSNVRQPSYVKSVRRAVASVTNTFFAKHGRKPTTDEVEEIMRETCSKWVRQYRGVVRKIIEGKMRVFSIDSLVQGNNGHPAFTVKGFYSPVYNAILSEEMECVERSLKRLKPKEELVLRMLYGLTGFKERSIKEVARSLELTDSRIGQIHERAFPRLCGLLAREGMHWRQQ